jgi:type II secretory pathway pseudopilin PulG
MQRIIGVLLLVACLSLAGFSQTQNASSNSDQQETIRALMQEVNELKARVAALEAKQNQPEQPPQPQATPQPEEKALAGAPQPGASGPEPLPFIRGIRFQGFGSVTYKASDANPSEQGASLGFRPGSPGNFAVGDVDLFLTSQLSNRTSVLGEVVFSEQNSGEFETDVERLLLKYNPSDYLKMSFGRFHTATSYYNTVFHHGLWLQTAADRPLVVEFSDHGGLLPSQAIGASVTGRIPSGPLGLNYILEYGSAATIRPQITTPDAPEIDENNGNEITGGLFLKPDFLPGLDVGGSFYHDRINPDSDNLHIGQSVASAHAVYTTPRFEFLNEAFLIQHKIRETGQTFNTPAFYSLISQQFAGKWRPYFRYQYVNASAASPLFADVSFRHGPSAGMRYDFNDYVAMKLQFDHTIRRGLTSFNDVLAQMAFRF